MNFTDLEVWKKARIFRNEMFEFCKTLPSSEKYSLKDQILRASRSVTANIAEGHGRFHLKENIQFCRMARGSLSEVLDHLICAFDCDYLPKEDLEKHQLQINEVNRMMNGYINYLKSQLTKPRN